MKRRNLIKTALALSTLPITSRAERYAIDRASPDNLKSVIDRMNSAGIEMILVRPGSFKWGDQGLSMNITRPFYLSKTPITFNSYINIMPNNSIGLAHGGMDREAPAIFGERARFFLKYISQLFNCPFSLPTEAQWEYACKGGDSYKYYIGDSIEHALKVAWFDQNSGGHLRPVGKLAPNGFGFYDMLGNIKEQCIDYVFQPDYINDYIGAVDVTGRLPLCLRGGDFFSSYQDCTVHSRVTIDSIDPARSIYGLRVCIHL